MKTLMIFLAIFIVPVPRMLFEFNPKSDIARWFSTDDVVMGGVSASSMQLDESGYGVFSGTVSIENNGGFAMTRCAVRTAINKHSTIEIKLKGDGKMYQFRIKSADDNRFWYVQSFQTSGDWQVIRLPLKKFEAKFRGRNLDLPNFNKQTISEIAFLIANKRTEQFKLKIASISLK